VWPLAQTKFHNVTLAMKYSHSVALALKKLDTSVLDNCTKSVKSDALFIQLSLIIKFL